MKQLKLMGILNITPDSFFDGGKYIKSEKLINRIEELIENNVDIIDIGAESTRPGSKRISSKQEISRLEPALKILKNKKCCFSIDTMNPETALHALNMGASMINDVSGFSNPKMIEIAANYECKICVMHMIKTPESMQNNPTYPQGVTKALIEFFKQKIKILLENEIKKTNIILDPGIGFGKTVLHNLDIIRNISELKKLSCPVLIGLSRKSFMKKILGKNTDELLPATLVMNTIALLGGADIIRVHDIPEHVDLINLLSRYNTG